MIQDLRVPPRATDRARLIRASLRAAAALATIGCALCLSVRPALGAPPAPAPFEMHLIQSKEIRESSGLVQSRKYPGVFWTHNDSGDRARIFAIDRDGRVICEISVTGAKNVDWEDITVDDSGHLYIGDIGNNSSRRMDLVVYKIAEPDPRAHRVNVAVERTLRFRYADQRIGTTKPDYDAESLIWFAGSLYIFTKHRTDDTTVVYRLPDQESSKEQVLSPLGSIELKGSVNPLTGNVTAADMSPDGRHLALLTYGALYVFERSGADLLPLRQIKQIPLNVPQTQQAESVAWDGNALIFGNEERKLFRVPNPLEVGTAAQP